MAIRSRSHVLEEESRRAFTNYISPEWVIETPQYDYGIDFQIRIFEDENMTPFLFYVQIKASDDVNYSEGRVVYSFKTARLLEYMDENIPVMLVVYNSEDKQMYYDWVHKIYKNQNSSARRKWQLQKTVTIPLVYSLNNTSHQLLTQEVRQQFYRLGYKQNNQKFSVFFSDNHNELMLWLRQNLDTEFIHIEDIGNDAKINFDDNTSSINLLIGRQSYTITYNRKLSPKEIITCMKYALVFTLSACGRSAIALNILRRLILDEGELSEVKNTFLISPSLAYLYASENRISEAFELAEFLVNYGEIEAALIMASSVLFNFSTSFHYSFRYRFFLEKLIGFSKDNLFTASIYYNLANNLSHNGYYKEAIHSYHKASKFDKTYQERVYWCAEIGGCLFLKKKFRWSEKYYRRAIALADKEEKPLLKFLLSDSLFYQGKFRKSAMLFDQSNNKEPIAEGILKEWVARELYLQFGDSPINIIESENLILKAESLKLYEEKEIHYMEALKLNPLSSLAWYNYFRSLKKNDWNKIKASIITAVLNNFDVDSWATTILFILQEKPELLQAEILEALIADAYRLFNSELEFSMSVILKSSGHNEPEKIINSISYVANELKFRFKNNTAFHIRLFLKKENISH